MIATRSVAAVFAAALALGGCGGGGSSPAPSVQAATPQTVGKASVTIKYPANFRLIHVSSTSATHAAASARTPQYVSPAGSTINITVTNTCETYSCNGYTSAPLSYPVSPNPTDGTQTISVPVYGGYNIISVTELDSSSNVDAFGTGNYFATSGVPQSFSVQMNMNATQLAVTTDPTFSGDSGTLISQTIGSPTFKNAGCPAAPVYFFAADPSGGVVGQATPVAGVGGIPSVALVGQSSDAAGTSKVVPLLTGGYQLVPDGFFDGVTATVSVTNSYNNATYYGYVDVTSGC